MILLTSIVCGSILGLLAWSWYDLFAKEGEDEWVDFK